MCFIGGVFAGSCIAPAIVIKTFIEKMTVKELPRPEDEGKLR
jgi:hypothetical protein